MARAAAIAKMTAMTARRRALLLLMTMLMGAAMASFEWTTNANTRRWEDDAADVIASPSMSLDIGRFPRDASADDAHAAAGAGAMFLQRVRDNTPDTVPAHVNCTKVKRCDKHKICAIVCVRGSVVVAPWLERALALQRRLAYTRSFCEVALPGSHNSAIDLADGYGVEDHVFTEYLKFFSRFKKGMEVHTNDQLFSLTDQLNMGVRFIELDVHWFNNDLRIAHCGGFHSGLLDTLIKYFNKIAKWLGTDIEWDSETIGCKPSLSSIPASEQRRLEEALEEVAGWMHDPKHRDEFLMVFFDDETDLFRWKKVERLLLYLKKYFPENEVVAPLDLVQSKGWPSFQELVNAGKRVIFLSASNYSTGEDNILFVRDDICNWTEPSLPFKPFPECEFERQHIGPQTFNGTIMRPETSEISYGFLNADGHLGPNENLLDEASIPPLVQCGVGIPSPDNITPLRMESLVWAIEKGGDLVPGKCVGLLRNASTWSSVECNHKNMAALCEDRSHGNHWILTSQTIQEHDGLKACTHQSRDLVFSVPTTGYENQLVQSLLQQAPNSIQGVWLNAKALVDTVYADKGDHDTTPPLPFLHQVSEIMSVE